MLHGLSARIPLVSFLALLGCAACVHVPPQIAQTHSKELEIISSLQRSHMAMVDAYVDQKIVAFEAFFFGEYGPAYLDHWRSNFKSLNGRDYDEKHDFHDLYSDLVAEYQSEVQPLEEVRNQLKDALSEEYRNAIEAHQAIGAWIKSAERLNAAQRGAIDRLLGGIKPGLSLGSVDKALESAKEKVKTRLAKLRS